MTTEKDFTEEEINHAGLTDEERAALEGDDDSTDSDGTEQGDEPEGSTADDSDTGGDDGGEGQDSADAGRDDGATGDDDGKQEEPEGDGDEPEPQAADRQYSPTIRGELPEDFDERLQKIGQTKQELRKQYNEGDIDFEEYEQKRDELEQQHRQLEQKQFKATIAQEMREDRWLNHDVANFMSEHPEYKPGSALYAMLDQEVRIRQAKAAEDGGETFDPAILQSAHSSIRERLAKDLGLSEGKAKRRASPPPARNAPPVIGGLPASDIEDAASGLFAEMDRLAEDDPALFQERMDAMSEADRKAYMDK